MANLTRTDDVPERTAVDSLSRSEMKRRPTAQVYQPPARRKAVETVHSCVPEVTSDRPKEEAVLCLGGGQTGQHHPQEQSVTTLANNSCSVEMNPRDSGDSSSQMRPKVAKNRDTDSRKTLKKSRRGKQSRKKQESPPLSSSDGDSSQTTTAVDSGGNTESATVQLCEELMDEKICVRLESPAGEVCMLEQGTVDDKPECRVRIECFSSKQIEHEEKAIKVTELEQDCSSTECPGEPMKGEMLTESAKLPLAQQVNTEMGSVELSQQQSTSQKQRQVHPVLMGVYVPPGRRAAEANQSSSKDLPQSLAGTRTPSSSKKKETLHTDADAFHHAPVGDGLSSADHQPVPGANHHSPVSKPTKKSEKSKKRKKANTEMQEQLAVDSTRTLPAVSVPDCQLHADKQADRHVERTPTGDQSRELPPEEGGISSEDDVPHESPLLHYSVDETDHISSQSGQSSSKEKVGSEATEVAVDTDKMLSNADKMIHQADSVIEQTTPSAKGTDLPRAASPDCVGVAVLSSTEVTSSGKKQKKKKTKKSKKAEQGKKAVGEKKRIPTSSSPVQRQNADAEVSTESHGTRGQADQEDSWERLLDDDAELAELTSAMSLENGELSRVVHASPDLLQSVEVTDPRFDADDCVHILELTCSVDAKTHDLTNALNAIVQSDSYVLKWVGPTNCLVGFGSSDLALQVLQAFLPGLTAKPLWQAGSKSLEVACSHLAHLRSLAQSQPKPERTAMVARRLVSSALNIHVPVSSEQRRFERRQLQQAREQKQRAAALRESVWDGD